MIERFKKVTMENLEKFLKGNDGEMFEVGYNDDYRREYKVYEIRDGVMTVEIGGKKYGDPKSIFRRTETLTPEETLKIIEEHPAMFKYGMI